VLRVWLQIARAIGASRSALTHYHADAIESGAAPEERPDGWAKGGAQSDPDTESWRTTAPRIGAAAGVLETGVTPAGKSRSALRIEHEYESLEAGWAGPRKWKRLGPQCSEFVRGQLEPVVEQIRAAKVQLERLSGQIEALVAEQEIPIGLGALTVSLLEGEVCDWSRFINRKAVGSYTGGCPSEHSSGGVQRFGAIDRHGNKHVRTLLVEAVWRLLKWQPQWHARQKYLQKLKVGASLKKKIAVALARQLAIDLWRWRTGRASAAELGFRVITGRRQMSGVN
jgi:hypothetical protein